MKSSLFNLLKIYFKKKKIGELRYLNPIQVTRTGKERFFHEKQLSFREQEVLEHLVEGKSYKEIAGILSISTETVKKHASNIYKKTDTHNKFELKYNVLEYTRWDYIDMNNPKTISFSA